MSERLNQINIICGSTVVLNLFGILIVKRKLLKVKSAEINNTFCKISIWMLKQLLFGMFFSIVMALV